MTPRFSIVVATVGRPTLERALQSLADQPLEPGDEVILVGPETVRDTAKRFKYRYLFHAPANDWGYTERAFGMKRAFGTHLAFLDDDDVYRPGAIRAMRAAVAAAPDRPFMFKMRSPWGEILWRRAILKAGNQGGAQFVVPNDQSKLGRYTDRYEADFDFMESTLALYPPGALVWDPTLIYTCGEAPGHDAS